MMNNMPASSGHTTYDNNGIQHSRNLTRNLDKMSDTLKNIPPIDQFTGESVMPSDSLLVPLVPATGQKPEAPRKPKLSQRFLENHIGQNVRVEFMLGTDGALIDRSGRLVEVGENYIVLQPTGTDDLLMCDLFAIKFVTISR